MNEGDNIVCPNCGKKYKWMPKGKLVCSCGQSIQADGANLEKFKIVPTKKSLKDSLPTSIEILIVFLIILIPATLYLRFKYSGTWLEAETNYFSKMFGISPESYDLLKVLIGIVVIVALIIWRKRKTKSRT